MSITIKDVAEKADCAIGTVSDILNRNKMGRYSDRTIEKVRNTARKLGYFPNKSASALRSGKTGVIGVTHSVLFSMDQGFSNPYVNRLHTGIGKAVSVNSYDFLIQNVNKATRYGEEPVEQFARSRQLDGFIYIYFSAYHEQYKKFHEPALKQARLPVVIIHSTVKGFAFGNVGCNTLAGGYLAVRHLLDHGYGSIGFAGYPRNRELNSMLYQGYCRVLQEAGRPVSDALVFNAEGNVIEAGVGLVQKILGSGTALPRAFFVAEETLAHGMIKGFNQAGIRVPDDVALIGFGEYFDDRLFDHQLTTLVQPAYEKGRLAGEQLFRLLEGGEAESIILEPELKIRTSCGCK